MEAYISFQMRKTAMFHLQNWDQYYVSKLKKCFFNTADVTQLEGGAVYDKHPPLTTSVW